MRVHRLFPAWLAVVVITASSWATPMAAGPPSAKERLASKLARVARGMVRAEVPSVPSLEVAVVVAREAAGLDPDNPNRWRMLRDLALLTEDDEAYAEAVREVVRTDPADDVARLSRIVLEIDRHQDIDSRVAAYERWLDPSVRDRIGPAVASRLALDLALVHRQAGDLDGFAARLAEAAALDPSNRTAAAIAAGFFRMHVDDPYAEAELLIDLALADPTDITTQAAIASLMLEHGAYDAAARFYRIVTHNVRVLRRMPPGTLLADEAAASWGGGRPQVALDIIRRRQQELDDQIQRRARIEEPSLDPVERGRRRGVLSPTLATTRAVILARQGSPDAETAVEQALASMDRLTAVEDVTDAAVAQVRLQMAWVALWLGGDLERASGLIEQAEALAPLTDVARSRFDGWRALRRGDLDAALGHFEPVDPPDPPILLGLAQTYHAQGRERESAQLLLQIARDDPGSLVGIWSGSTLLDRLGRRVPISETARRLEELAETVPSSFDRYPESPSLAVSFNVRPRQTVYAAHTPLLFDIEITNNTALPLAIDRDGPLRPPVILTMSTDLARLLPPIELGDGMARRAQLPRIVVDIDHRIRLEPREQLVVTVDLFEYALGELVDSEPRHGGFLRVKGSFNALRVRSGAIEPGLLGSDGWTDTLRIEGARIDLDWMAQRLGELSGLTGTPSDAQLVQLALVMDVVAHRLPPDAPPEFFQYLAKARAHVGQIFLKLDPAAQAWLLATVPASRVLDRFTALVEQVRSSEDRLVQLVYLLRYVRDDNDPVFQRALASADPSLRLIAERIEAGRRAATRGEDEGS